MGLDIDMPNFGWNLPPGVTNRMIDEAAGAYDVCEICGRDCEDCICPECPVCGTVGDPKCYDNHGMVMSLEQITSVAAEMEKVRQENLMLDRMWLDDEYHRCLYGDDPYDDSFQPDLWNAIGWASR